ncbi:hypothetical protein VTO42DRAFT_6201 [Malbranchea cinnamomea]
MASRLILSCHRWMSVHPQSPSSQAGMNASQRYRRYVLFAIVALALLHFASFSPSKPLPDSATLVPDVSSTSSPGDDVTGVASLSDTGRANATFVSLVKNEELPGIAQSIKQVEDRFNRNYHYDWVFLNDREFDEDFKAVTSAMVSGNTYYGRVPRDHWSFPSWIDPKRAAAARQEMKKLRYGSSTSYRHMCRYQSGFFFRHPLMLKYDYYWRVEPNVQYHCDIPYDPFKLLRDTGKKYGWVISLHEYAATIPTLWESTKRFIQKHPEHIAKGNSLGFVSNDGGRSYNLCHFWSNFEIGDLNWLRSPAYLDYFNHLDQEGGFFYERWGDAPVHSIAAALMLKKEELHFFDEIAYTHDLFTHCPTSERKRHALRCTCSAESNFDWRAHSCTSLFFRVNNMQKPQGYVWQTDWFPALIKVLRYLLMASSVVIGICGIVIARRRRTNATRPPQKQGQEP